MTAPAPEIHQAGQALLATDLARAVAEHAWPEFDPQQIQASMPRLVALVMALIHRYGTASAVHAQSFYRAQRLAAGIPGRVQVPVAPLPSTERVAKSLQWATSGLYGPVTPETARNALTNVQGVTQTLSLDMGRDTIINAVQADQKAIGWARVPEPGACSFCLLLATRGGDYVTKKSATANARSRRNPNQAAFLGEGKFKVHDHCRCHVEPVFNEPYEPTAQVRAALALYESTDYGRNAKEARNNFRVALEKQRDTQAG